jgi:hypothetical protein
MNTMRISVVNVGRVGNVGGWKLRANDPARAGWKSTFLHYHLLSQLSPF